MVASSFSHRPSQAPVPQLSLLSTDHGGRGDGVNRLASLGCGFTWVLHGTSGSGWGVFSGGMP